jgi:hypothetical protein
MEGVFTSHPDMSDARNFYVMSSRTSWAKMHLDPPKAGKYWRSVIGDLRMTAAEFRGG